MKKWTKFLKNVETFEKYGQNVDINGQTWKNCKNFRKNAQNFEKKTKILKIMVKILKKWAFKLAIIFP